MNRIVFAIIWLASFSAAPALAQQTKVGGWMVEKRTQDQHCNASRGYRDAEDENRDYAIVLTYSDDAIVMVLIYDGWEWDKTGEILRANFAIDNDDIMRKAKWEVMDRPPCAAFFSSTSRSWTS